MESGGVFTLGTEWLVIGIAMIALYFVPTIVARVREHHNTTAIFLLNLLLGWTFVGWVVALVWAATRVLRSPG